MFLAPPIFKINWLKNNSSKALLKFQLKLIKHNLEDYLITYCRLSSNFIYGAYYCNSMYYILLSNYINLVSLPILPYRSIIGIKLGLKIFIISCNNIFIKFNQQLLIIELIMFSVVFCNDYYYCPKTHRCCVFGFYACCRDTFLPDGKYGKQEIIHATRVSQG